VGETLPGHVTQRWAQLLPGAKAIIYTGHTNVDVFDEASLVVQPLDGGAPRELMKGGYHWRYVPSGHILYVHSTTLFAVPFDLERLAVTGVAVPVVDQLQVSPTSGGAQFSVGPDGPLLYARGTARTSGDRISLLDLAGKVTSLVDTEENFQTLAFSPDASKLAFEIADGRALPEIWVQDLRRGSRTRLTVNQVADMAPVWTVDGKRLVYASASEGSPNLFWQPADGSGPPERLLRSDAPQMPGGWHPDGRRLVFMQGTGGAFDIHLLTLPERAVTPLITSPANEGHPRISPDGKWLAYTSNETGQIQVYVRPFPDGAGRWPISTSPSAWPMWSSSERALFYIAMEGHVMRVDYDVTGGAFQAGRPVPVPNGEVIIRGAGYSQAMHPDGKRLATAVPRRREGPAARDEIILVSGFLDDLKAREK
jgi:serine/threonine-protein kinase